MVSAISAGRPDEWSEQMRPYYEAKAGADERLMESGLDYTIVRPGGLTDDPGTGPGEGRHGPRATARFRATTWPPCSLAVLETPGAWARRSSWSSGDTPVDEAVRAL